MKKNKKFIIIFLFIVYCFNLAETIHVQAATSIQVLKGRNGWLFYKNENDGTSIPEYIGNNHYSKTKMKSIKNNLLKMQKAVKKKGAEFVVCIIPSKEVVYPEYMPKSIKRKSTVTRTDKLVKYLKKNSNLKIVYVKQELLDAKGSHQLYYKTDTHWNAKGRFIGAQMLRQEITGAYADIDDVKFKIKARKFSGDLASLLGQASYYRTDVKYSLASKIKKSEKSRKNIAIVGDSFGEGLAEYTNKYFGKVNYTKIWNFSMKKIEKKTDVVVWECAERYIDRFRTVSLHKK